MGLKDIGSKLPPGFRFHPSDEELVCHYLCNKIKAKSIHHDDVYDDDGDDDDDVEALKRNTDLVEIDLHICEPWQLPDVAKLNTKEWYFFSFRDRKYATGYRTNRATISGYWKATGKDRTIIDPKTKELVGMRKTLVFYRNRAPNGIKTTWIMHEFRLECPNMPPKEDWVLCRVFNKGKSDENNQTLRFEINDDNHEMQSCVWDELIEIPSRTTNHAHHHNHNQTIPCGWDQMMITSLSSSSTHGPPVDHQSLLNMLFVEDNNNNIIDHDHYHHGKTCMASSSDGMVVSDHLQIESGGLSFDETDNNLVTFQ